MACHDSYLVWQRCGRAFLRCLIIPLVISGCSAYLFYPQKKWQLAPETAAYEYHLADIETPDHIRLNGMVMPHRGDTMSGAVLFFHGNDGNISVYAGHVSWLVDQGYDVVLVDYRGYGLSAGEVDLDRNIADIRVVSQWFIKRYPHAPRFLMAHSLGASMAGYVMAIDSGLCRQFSAIVLESGFAEYRRIMRDAMARSWLTWLWRYPASLGMPDDYDLLDVVQEISPTPLLLVHGKDDPVVPYAHGLDLYEKARSPKEFLAYEGGHNDAWDIPLRRQMLLDFLVLHRD